jgi:hypothetical protein
MPSRRGRSSGKLLWSRVMRRIAQGWLRGRSVLIAGLALLVALAAGTGSSEGALIHRHDGPTCAEWGTSLSCHCPPKDQSAAPKPHAKRGEGLLTVELSYPTPRPNACPGGVAIESPSGKLMASAGYTAAGHHVPGSVPGPGIPPDGIVTFAIKQGVWRVLGDNQRYHPVEQTISVTAGKRTTIHLTIPPPEAR